VAVSALHPIQALEREALVVLEIGREGEAITMVLAFGAAWLVG
jgi:hypothetical protein